MIALTVEFFVSLAQAFIPIYEIMAVARFLIGTCIGGFFTTIFVMSKPLHTVNQEILACRKK